MVQHEGGQWNVATKDNAVYLERVSESDEQLFEDLLEPEAARELAELLTKHARKLDEAGKSDESKEPDESEESAGPDQSKDSEKSDDSEESAGSRD